jgi:hypothetical protein
MRRVQPGVHSAHECRGCRGRFAADHCGDRSVDRCGCSCRRGSIGVNRARHQRGAVGAGAVECTKKRQSAIRMSRPPGENLAHRSGVRCDQCSGVVGVHEQREYERTHDPDGNTNGARGARGVCRRDVRGATNPKAKKRSRFRRRSSCTPSLTSSVLTPATNASRPWCSGRLVLNAFRGSL